jgi:hypothetical protein
MSYDVENAARRVTVLELGSEWVGVKILQQQVQELNQSQHWNERWTRWLGPTVKVLHVFSETLGEVVTLVCLSS